jgi:cadmium resistance protein CadD (predicted permease)
MKKILVYLFVNVILVSFFVYTGHTLATSAFMSDVSKIVRVVSGLINMGITVMVVYEINKKLKQHLDKKY